MIPLVIAAISIVIVVAGVVASRRARATARLEDDLYPAGEPADRDGVEPLHLQRRRWIALLLAVLAFAAARFAGLGWLISFGVTVLVGALGIQLESFWFVRRQVRYETQLAEALDLMVGALRAGVGIVEALSAGAARVGRPLRPLLRDMVERLRVGDSPTDALTSLGRAVPLESYRLTGLTLAASWEGGGGYADALAGVGRTTRERLALRRRLNSQSLEARTSVAIVLDRKSVV